MLKFSLAGFIILAFSFNSFAQTDTLYLNNQKIACSVKEVTQDGVKYSYPNEDLVNTVYKNSVQKIVFKSGRVQSFTESTSFKQVNGVEDYANVTVTTVESEVKGLYKIGDVGSKAKGTTTFSSQERVKERAYRKLKMQAAMMGGNIIYLTNQRNEGNKFGGYFQSGSSTETNLTGISYSNSVPSLDDFKKLLNSRTTFATYEQYRLAASNTEFSKDDVVTNFNITNIINDNGIITIEGSLGTAPKFTSFKLAYFNSDHFSIFYNDKSTVYNISVKL